MRRPVALSLVGLLVLSCALLVGYTTTRDYRVRVVLPNAGNLFVGGSVMVDGYEAGSITDIDVEDGKALLELSLDDEFAPLHDGASVEVVWKAALGERLLRVEDGPDEHEELAEGALLTGVQAEPVELDAVLSTLDAPTRERVASLVTSLRHTLDEREAAANASLRTAGPALRELGAVLREVNTDGEAIKQIVEQFDQTMQIVGEREQSLEQVITSLAGMAESVAAQDDELGATLGRLPGVLQHATGTLGRVPGTVDQTLPMLEELAPATEHLRPVAKNLRPLLQDLRPTVDQLRPTLDSLSRLLGITPGLLEESIGTIPDADRAMTGLTPALDFLRPYTPEIAGWGANWGSAAGNYDNNGHYTRFHILAGLESAIGSTSLPGPGVTQDLTPAPGAPVGQPWTDAYGSGMR
jgi:phospholipid/cholesterol/gamma-HCH transport system substrate-binding protein